MTTTKKRLFSYVLLSSVVLAQSTFALTDSITGYKKIVETLRLIPGSSENCQSELRNTTAQGTFWYAFNTATNKGQGIALIDNLSDGLPPIKTNLWVQGDDDRYGFARYYLPAKTIFVNHSHPVGLRGIILNECMDHTVQAGLMIVLPRINQVCILATPVWNYCR